MEKPILHAENIHVVLGKTEILKGISLDILPGEILTIIGPNGSGKSTLIKAICRLLKPAEGQVTLDGQDIRKMNNREISKKIAILPQKKSLPSDITVERLVQYGRVPYAGFGGRLSAQDNAVIDRMLKITGTEKFRFRRVSSLSGGEAQMAWIAMALAQQPEILFLDEPTTFLDISYQLAVLDLVRGLQKTEKISVVMVLHDLNQAALISDRLAILKAGELRCTGAPIELCSDRMFRDIFRVETEQVSYQGGRQFYIPTKMIQEAE